MPAARPVYVDEIEFRERLGAAIRLVREAKGVNLKGLSISVGISKGQLSAIENGTKFPSASVLWLIEKHLSATNIWARAAKRGGLDAG